MVSQHVLYFLLCTHCTVIISNVHQCLLRGVFIDPLDSYVLNMVLINVILAFLIKSTFVNNSSICVKIPFIIACSVDVCLLNIVAALIIVLCNHCMILFILPACYVCGQLLAHDLLVHTWKDFMLFIYFFNT